MREYSRFAFQGSFRRLFLELGLLEDRFMQVDVISEIDGSPGHRFFKILLSKLANSRALLLQPLQPFAFPQLLILPRTFSRMIMIILVLLCCLLLFPTTFLHRALLLNHLDQLIFVILLQLFHQWRT